MFLKTDGSYVLADYTRGKGIETYDAKYTDLATDFRNYPGSLASHTASTFQDPKAVSAHYLATKVYDFYKEKYQRNSFDNKGQKLHRLYTPGILRKQAIQKLA